MSRFTPTKITPSSTLIGSIDHSRGPDRQAKLVLRPEQSGLYGKFPDATVLDGKTYRLFSVDGAVAKYICDDPAWIELSPETLIREIGDTSIDFIDEIFAAASGNEQHVPIKGHICGRDNGKPERKIQKRNDPCCCGSGKKAKKCCVYFPAEERSE